jgi:predicted hotdog family 3-hydroxylacyl-ACP dehydratase
MLISGNQILELIPHRKPMVMIDKLIHCDEQKARSSFTIEPDNIFVDKGFFSEAGMIENMAQTSALMTGWLNINQNTGEQKMKLGVIGAVKDLTVYFLPEINSEITTEIEVIYKVANASVVKGRVTVAEKLACECEMKIFMTDTER